MLSRWKWRTLAGVAAAATLLGAGVAYQSSRPRAFHLQKDITIPFESVNHSIVLKVEVEPSQPLSFVLDSGDKCAIIDTDAARAAGVELGGTLPMHGSGSPEAQHVMLLKRNQQHVTARLKLRRLV